MRLRNDRKDDRQKEALQRQEDYNKLTLPQKIKNQKLFKGKQYKRLIVRQEKENF